MKIRIGTRKSKLAFIQTEMVISELKRNFSELEYEIVPICECILFVEINYGELVKRTC